MIAYSEKELYNNHILVKAREAFEASMIGAESLQKIEKTYPCKLYTPNYFIAFALGLLTLIAFSFTAFLFGISVNANSTGVFTITSILMAILSYFSLEWVVKIKMYFNAGVDNALMLLVLIFTSSIFIITEDNHSWIFINSLLMMISVWLSMRFTDAFMAMVSASFFFVICYLLFLKAGGSIFLSFSLGMMTLIGGLYFLLNQMAKRLNFIYEKCVNALRILLLVAFYAAGNFWLISELQGLNMEQNGKIPFGGLFWVFTLLTPVLYLVYGVVKKDLLILRTGLFLTILTILTYKFYYSLLPVEVEMLLMGSVLITTGFFFIKWLCPERHGFTSDIISPKPGWKNIEALIIAGTMGEAKIVPEDTLMAGGSSGGGGASGDF